MSVDLANLKILFMTTMTSHQSISSNQTSGTTILRPFDEDALPELKISSYRLRLQEKLLPFDQNQVPRSS